MFLTNKKKVAAVSGVVASLCILGSAFANEGIKLVVDGQPTVPTVTPQNIDGTVMVPIRFVSDTLGATVQWDQDTGTVSIDTQGKEALQLEVEQFVHVLAPTSPDQAVELYMNGLQQRNGALQYAALSEELKANALPDFEKNNWVTGVSSPWFANWSVVKQEKINEETILYEIKTQMATSTGLGRPAIMKLTVAKMQEHWFVSSLGDDQPVSATSSSSRDLIAVEQNGTKWVTIKGLEGAIPYQMSPGAVIAYNEKGEMEINKKGLLEEIRNDQYQNIEVLLPPKQPGLHVNYDGMSWPSFFKLKDSSGKLTPYDFNSMPYYEVKMDNSGSFQITKHNFRQDIAQDGTTISLNEKLK